ncbi:MAG TPA: hypothetical protein VJA26_08665 [Gammaproteobacteria bacterium]|nr:hypothetical protein [Gammaproteobacteria bacterium]
MNGKRPFADLRVVELAAPLISCCGKLFADPGAEVQPADPQGVLAVARGWKSWDNPGLC